MSNNCSIKINFVLPLTTFYGSGAQRSNVNKCVCDVVEIPQSRKPISSTKPLCFSLPGIQLVKKNSSKKYLYSAYFPDISLIHPFANFFIFFPVSSNGINLFLPGSHDSFQEIIWHVNSNTVAKYCYFFYCFCCCLLSLKKYNILQGQIVPIHPF